MTSSDDPERAAKEAARQMRQAKSASGDTHTPVAATCGALLVAFVSAVMVGAWAGVAGAVAVWTYRGLMGE